MGRYDKIKLWNGSTWVKPSRIKVRANGDWQDFGEDLSDNTRTLEVRHNDAWHRCTKNRFIRITPGEKYATGEFSLKPPSSFGYNNYTGPSDFKLEFVARKETDTTVTIFRSGNDTNTCLFKIEWLASGAFKITNATTVSSDGTAHSVTTTVKVMAGNWATVKIRAPKGTYAFSITINGVTQDFQGVWYYWAITNATNQVGATGVDFKDTFFIQAHYYINASTSGTKQVTIDMNTASGTSNDYENITHVDTSTEEVIWI